MYSLKTSKPIFFQDFEKDKLLNEINDISMHTKIKSLREFIQRYPMLTELRQLLEDEKRVPNSS